MKKNILIALLLLTKLHSEVIPGSEEALLSSIVANTNMTANNTRNNSRLIRDAIDELIMIKKLNHKQLKVQARMLVEMRKQTSFLEKILKTLNN